ncbi:MAG: PLP-dependent transferase [Chloroflexi bacterium]|nr:PLP-dependent transferase [Chloroflexota bacterium]
MHLETTAVHAGHAVDPATGAVTPPIHLSTTFERAEDGGYPSGFSYGRKDNPNRHDLESALSQLEGGASAIMLASGSAAAMTLFQTLRPGDHVIAPLDLYFGVRVMLTDIFGPWGLETTFVDMTDPAQARAAVRPTTRLILIETPSNPQIKLTDIRALAEIAHGAGAALACDNTFATPLTQRPLELGADLVIHATTKYLSGHHDVLGGVVIAREETPLFERMRMIRHNGGAIPSPFECWLTLRGLQSLAWRMRGHGENALRLAQFLEQHPRVERVLYPGLPSHPQHALAVSQMRGSGGLGFGGMMSILVKGTQEDALRVSNRVRLFTRATSFGSPHSLVEHRASIEAPGTTTPVNLLRLSIGLEHIDDLIADMDQALG